MVRGKIQTEYIQDPKTRSKCFKKRRMGILKKAMQLELITGCSVHLQVINKEDSSLISYGQISEGIRSDGFDQYAKFSRDHYDFFSKIEN